MQHPTDLSDLVPGNTKGVNQALDWLDKLNRAAVDLGVALHPALKADDLGPAACSVVLGRVEQQARWLRELLANRGYQGVVVPEVAAPLDTLLDQVADACQELATAARGGKLPVGELLRWLARIRSPQGELKRLQELLLFAQLQRGELVQPSSDEAEFTRPESPTKLAKAMGISRNTLRNHIQEGKIACKTITTKRIQIPLSCIPSEKRKQFQG